MNTWEYDLRTEGDPLVRLGIHGLWRHLSYGLDRESETLSWELSDAFIRLHWKEAADLNRLMSRMVGELSDGIAVPPGYPSDRRDQSIYATVLAHKGVTQHFFAKKGAARTRSALEPDRVNPAEAPWSREGNEKRIELVYTRHRLHDDAPSLDVDKRGALSPNQTLGVVYHPMCSKWNDVAVTVDPKVKFALAFACLAHIYTVDRAAGSPFGLGVDAATFGAADDIHRLWIEQPLVWAPDEETAAWGIAARVGLPPGTYVRVGERGASFFSITCAEVTSIYSILLDGMGVHDALKAVSILDHIEIDRKHSGRDAYSRIIRNVRLGQAWYTGVLPLEQTYTVRKAMTTIFMQRSTAMEQQIAQRLSKIKSSLAARYVKRYGSEKSRGYDRADAFILVHLTRARNRPALLKAVAAITREAGRGFTADELGWLLERTEKRCSEVQSLLVLACTTFFGASARPAEEPGLAEQDLGDVDFTA